MNPNLFKDKNILITGGVGFIGSNLACRLLEYGANVTLVDSLIPEYGGNLSNIEHIRKQVRLNISDVRDEYSLKYLIRGQNFLFNLAGQTSHMDSMKDPMTDLEINAKSQLSILECCREHNEGIKIVFASTRQIYGKPDYLPVDETHPIRPVDVNGINKMAGEYYHILYNNVYKIKSCALRLTNTYGPHMRIKDSRQTFLGIWIRLLIENHPFEVWEGQQLRDFTYVDDCVEALLLAAASDKVNGGVFNLGGPSVISLRELADLMIQINSQGSYSIHEYPIERKKIDIGDYYSDYTLFSELVGWEPKVDMKEGLRRTIDFYKKNHLKYI